MWTQGIECGSCFLSRIFTPSHHTSLSTFSSSTAKNKGHNTRKKFFSIAPFFYFAKLPNHTNTHPHILSVKKCFVPKKNVN